jgi:hypothetical protein
MPKCHAQPLLQEDPAGRTPAAGKQLLPDEKREYKGRKHLGGSERELWCA